jgi:hypothetical protein
MRFLQVTNLTRINETVVNTTNATAPRNATTSTSNVTTPTANATNATNVTAPTNATITPIANITTAPVNVTAPLTNVTTAPVNITIPEHVFTPTNVTIPQNITRVPVSVTPVYTNISSVVANMTTVSPSNITTTVLPPSAIPNITLTGPPNATVTPTTATTGTTSIIVTNATTPTGIPIIPQPLSNVTGPAIIMANTTATNLTELNRTVVNRTSSTGPTPSGRLLLEEYVRILQSNNVTNATNTTTTTNATTTNVTAPTNTTTTTNATTTNATAPSNATTTTNATTTNATVTNVTTAPLNVTIPSPVPIVAAPAPVPVMAPATTTNITVRNETTVTPATTNITTTNMTTPMGIPVTGEAVRNATIANATIIPTLNIPASPLMVPGTNITANQTVSNITRTNVSTTNVLFTIPLGTNITANETGVGTAFSGMRANLTNIPSTSNVSLAIPVITTVPGMTNVAGLTGINTGMGGSMSNLTGSATSFPVLIPVALGPAIPALINNPRRESTLLQLNMSGVNLTSFTLSDILPAISNNLTNLNASGVSSLISNTNTPLIIRNLLDYSKADGDVYVKIKSLLETLIKSPNVPNNDYKFLAYVINKKMLSNYEYNCLPNAHILFLSNLKDNTSALMKEFTNPQCEDSNKNYIITLNNNTATCHNCPTENILIKNFTFIDQSKIPADYFFSTACLNGKRIIFSYMIDKTGIPFINFSDGQVNPNVKDSFNYKCIIKAFRCSSDTGSDEYCPFNLLNSMCKNELSQKCRESGLYKLIDTLKYFNTFDFILPAQCNIGLFKDSSEMYNKCLNYLFNTFLSGGMNINQDKMSDYERLIYSSPEKITGNTLRFLQTTPMMLNATPASTVLIVPNSDDPTRRDEIANKINRDMFNSSVVVIDGASGMDRGERNITEVVRDYMKEFRNNTSVAMGSSNREVTTSTETRSNTTEVRRLSGSILKTSMVNLLLIVLALFLF